jgi:O-antigen/teichoic acid export membrane protein
MEDGGRITRLLQRLARVLRVIRLRPFDMATPEGRSNERYRRAALTTVTSVGCKCISMLALLVSVPLTIRYLGVERYGMWITITSTVAMFSFADLGVGNGLLSVLADAVGRNDRDRARAAVASALAMSGAIAVILMGGAGLAYPIVNWAGLFNVHSPAAVQEAGPALLMVLVCFAVNLPLGVVARVENGLQNGFVQNLWAAGGSLCSLAGLLVAIAARAGLPPLVVAVSAGPLISALGNGVQLFGKQSWLRPSIVTCEMTMMRRLFKTGLLFFVIQAGMAVAYQTDNLVIAHILGAEAVPAYAIPARMFMIVAGFLSIVMGPLWPAYTDAIASGDRDWVNRAFRRSCAGSLAATLPTALTLVVFGNTILRTWVGPNLQAPLWLLVLFGIRCLMASYLYPAVMLLNGLGEIKFQALTMAAMALSNIVISVLLVLRIGILGAIAGTVIAETIFLIVPLSCRVRRVLQQTRPSEIVTCVST